MNDLMMRLSPLRICLALLAALALAQPARAQGGPDPEYIRQLAVDRLMKSVCWIHQGDKHGTGWVVDAKKRLIITNQHVASGKNPYLVHFPVRKQGEPKEWENDPDVYLQKIPAIEAKVLDADRNNDLALLELASLPQESVALEIAKEAAPQGATLHTIGGVTKGAGGLWSYTHGTVRSHARGDLANGGKTDLLEAQMPFNQGNSGGPIIDNHGRLVAVVEGYRVGVRDVSIGVAAERVQLWYQQAQRLADPTDPYSIYRQARDLLEAGEWEQSLPLLETAIQKEKEPLAAKEYTEHRELAWKQLAKLELGRFGLLADSLGVGLVKEHAGDKLKALMSATEEEKEPAKIWGQLKKCRIELERTKVDILLTAADRAVAKGSPNAALQHYEAAARLEPQNAIIPAAFCKIVAQHPSAFFAQAALQLNRVQDKGDRALLTVALAQRELAEGKVEQSQKRVAEAVHVVNSNLGPKIRILNTWWMIKELIAMQETDAAKQVLKHFLDRQDPDRNGQELGKGRGADGRVFHIAFAAGMAARLGDAQLEQRAEAMFNRCLRLYRLGGQKFDLRPALASLFPPKLEAIKLVVQGKYDEALESASRGRMRSTWLIFATAIAIEDLPQGKTDAIRQAWGKWKQRENNARWGLTEDVIQEIATWYGGGRGFDSDFQLIDDTLDAVDLKVQPAGSCKPAGFDFEFRRAAPRENWLVRGDKTYYGLNTLREVDLVARDATKQPAEIFDLYRSAAREAPAIQAARLMGLVEWAKAKQQAEEAKP